MMLFFSALLLSLINLMQLQSFYLLSVIVSAGMNLAVLILPLILYRIDYLTINEARLAKTPYELVIKTIGSDV